MEWETKPFDYEELAAAGDGITKRIKRTDADPAEMLVQSGGAQIETSPRAPDYDGSGFLSSDALPSHREPAQASELNAIATSAFFAVQLCGASTRRDLQAVGG